MTLSETASGSTEQSQKHTQGQTGILLNTQETETMGQNEATTTRRTRKHVHETGINQRNNLRNMRNRCAAMGAESESGGSSHGKK